MSFSTKFRIISIIGCRLVEQAQSVFQAQYTAGSIIYTAHRYTTFFHQFLQQTTKAEVIRVHGHVDTCIDCHFDSLFLILGHLFAFPKIIDISPVGYNHTVPIQVFLQPLGQQFIIGMYRHPVNGTGIGHNGQSTLTNSCQIRSKMLFT